jgi:ribosome maturation factor RimP
MNYGGGILRCFSDGNALRLPISSPVPQKHEWRANRLERRENVTNKELIRRVTELVTPICQEAEVSLWDVTFEKEGRQHVLTVFIDREEGVNITHCEQVSRALDPQLDAKVFDSLPPYTLTVSSAGLERPLIRPEHFQWAMGKAVHLSFYKATNGANELVGTLKAYDGVQITVAEGEEEKTFAMADVARVRLHFEF